MIGAAEASLLLDRERWRQLRATVGNDPNEFILSVDEDPKLTAALEEPFESVEDVRDRLGWVEGRLLDTDDRRAVFLTVYTKMTEVTIRELRSGTFDDPDWMERYLVRFAEYYRRALLEYERGRTDQVPNPWIVAFGTALRGDTLVLQDALLGINAHINYDLALTLADIGLAPNRPQKYADHNRVNRILQQLVSVQRQLLAERYAPGLERVGEHIADLDTIGVSVGLRTAREKAWRVAVVRSDARWLPVDRYTVWLLTRTATGAAYVLLRPTTDSSTLQVLRDLEADEFDLRRYARDYHRRVRSSV